MRGLRCTLKILRFTGILMLLLSICLGQAPSLSANMLTPTIKSQPCHEALSDTVELYPEQSWLAPEELARYLEEINIIGAEIPPELGMPFLAIDWDSDTFIAEAGRLVAIGFETLHHRGSRWGAGTLEYASYDFVIGAEYDRHAQPEDYETLQSGDIEPDFTLQTEDNTQAYITYSWHPRFESIEKKIIFPFSEYYIAIVYTLEGDYRANYAAVIDDLYQEIYPEDEQCMLALMDALAASLVFAEQQFPDAENSGVDKAPS